MADADDPCAVYVGGLSYDVDDDILRKEFSGMGEIASTKVIYDRDTRQPRGFGFVVFAHPRAAATAIRKMDGQLVDGRPIRVSEVRKRDERPLREIPRGGGYRDHRDREPRFRDRERHVRRSPVPARGRGRSPVISRQSFSPRAPKTDRRETERSPRPSSPLPNRRRSRSPSSPIESPGRKDGEPELPQEEEKNKAAPNDEIMSEKELSRDQEMESEQPAIDLDNLQKENERLKAKESELTEQVKTLEAVLDGSSSTEAALLAKVQKLEQTLKESSKARLIRSGAITKIYRAVSRIQAADEQKKEGEKELKVIMSSVASEIEPADDVVG